MTTDNSFLRESTCPACGYHVAVSFYDGGSRPMATLAWPVSREEALSMKGFPLDFVQCIDCGHIYNTAFDYTNVPYSDKPNLMFNKGRDWSRFIDRLLEMIVDFLPENPTVVEIGYGDGSFLMSLARKGPGGRYIGFDPNGADPGKGVPVELHQSLFNPWEQMGALKPDLIISRHVMEHLNNPLGFIQNISFAAAWAGITTRLYLEVPCVDRAVANGRTVDFYYEHNSHFTTTSFSRMLDRCSARLEEIGHVYNREVIYGLVQLGINLAQIERAKNAISFQKKVDAGDRTIRAQLKDLAGRKTAIWGGTGKGAAFINTFDISAELFPVVVDSDENKVGTFVPGTGQLIRHCSWLQGNPVQVIIIPMHWRSKDIVAEMTAMDIAAEEVLIEHQGRLVDFHKAHHPYRER